jgi:hypothetical protein
MTTPGHSDVSRRVAGRCRLQLCAVLGSRGIQIFCVWLYRWFGLAHRTSLCGIQLSWLRILLDSSFLFLEARLLRTCYWPYNLPSEAMQLNLEKHGHSFVTVSSYCLQTTRGACGWRDVCVCFYGCPRVACVCVCTAVRGLRVLVQTGHVNWRPVSRQPGASLYFLVTGSTRKRQIRGTAPLLWVLSHETYEYEVWDTRNGEATSPLNCPIPWRKVESINSPNFCETRKAHLH